MKKIYPILTFIFGLSYFTSAQLTCGDTFLDAGGANGNYINNTDDTIVICATMNAETAKVTFSEFDIEDGYDFMTIYDNDSAVGIPLGIYTGTDSPGTIIAENLSGCLTFRFLSDDSVENPGWSASIECVPDVVCFKPTSLILESKTDQTATFSWTPGGSETQWLVEYGLRGFTLGTGTEVITLNNSYTIMGLSQLTSYDVYIRSYCGVGDTSFPRKIKFTTPLGCGEPFIDSGGESSDYAVDENYSVTTCPTTNGETTRVIFSEFNIEEDYDFMIIYDNDSAVGIPIGIYTGINSPGTIIAENPSGCLTFHFFSDEIIASSGWVATISCIPELTCLRPTSMSLESKTDNSATISWTSVGSETQWLVEYGEPGFIPGTGMEVLTSNNPYTIIGLTEDTYYDIYIRAYCGVGDTSFTKGPLSFKTELPPFVCGNLFTDAGGANGNYMNNTDDTTLICPITMGEVVVLTFTSFHIESIGQSGTVYDSLTIYNGDSTSDPIIGSYYGTNSPEMVYSTNTNGCLTVVFHSDNTVVASGWEATIDCIPAITCIEPLDISLVSKTINSATISWTAGGSETQWLVEYGPIGFTPGSGTEVLVSSNPYTINGLSESTNYSAYIRAYCGVGDTSFREGPLTFQTNLPPFICGNLFTDPGGPNGNYYDNTDDTTIICPTIDGQVVSLSFSSLETDVDEQGIWDSLTIYNGNSTSDPIIGSYYGTTNPGVITSTNANGCLTAVFHSDNIINFAGWVAQINCIDPPSNFVTEIEINYVNIFPNPSKDKFTIKNENEYDLKGELLDAQGRNLSQVPLINSNKETVLDLADFENGIYFFKVSSIFGTKTYTLMKN